MAAHVGWRNFWWLNTGILGLTVILTIFLLPETKWDRGSEIDRSSSSPIAKDGHAAEMEDSIAKEKTNANGIIRTLSASDPYLGKGYPSKSQFKLFQPKKNFLKTVLVAVWLPWKLFAFPIVEFAAFVVSWAASAFLMTNITQSEAFAAPPYNYSSQTIGEWTSTNALYDMLITLGRLLQLRYPWRSFYRAPHSWSNIRLDLNARNKTQPWHPRARDAFANDHPLSGTQHSRQFRCRFWLPIPLAMGGHCDCGLWLHRYPSCCVACHRLSLCHR